MIDCPPSPGLAHGQRAQLQPHEVLVPIQCEYYALEGLGQLLRNVHLVRRNLNPTLDVSTIVVRMYDARTKLADQVAARSASHFGGQGLANRRAAVVRLSEAPSYGQPIIMFDPIVREGLVAYRDVAKEVHDESAQRLGKGLTPSSRRRGRQRHRGTDGYGSELTEVRIAECAANAAQPRIALRRGQTSPKALAASIAEIGVLQPVLVRPAVRRMTPDLRADRRRAPRARHARAGLYDATRRRPHVRRRRLRWSRRSSRTSIGTTSRRWRRRLATSS